jgi:glycosyltransferase involved in cell wall biosynthesis
MAPKKKVVLWCSKPPYPAQDGGSRAIQSTLKSLQRLDLELWVVCLSTYKHPFLPEKWTKEMDQERLLIVPVQTKVHWWMGFKMLWSTSPFQLWRFGRTPKKQKAKARAFWDAISPDLVIWDGLPATWWRKILKIEPQVKEIYRSHNVEHKVYEALWQRKKNPLKKALLLKENRRLCAYEEQLWKSVDEVWSISELDHQVISRHKGVKSTYWPTPYYGQFSKVSLGEPIRFFHLGAMDWKPNRAGVEWLVKEVWPLVIKVIPDATLHLAGKAFPKDVDWGKQPGISCYGELDEIGPFISQMDVLIVPVWEGSGIRIKILEALDFGKFVLSTPVGLEGLSEELKATIPSTNKPEEFAQLMLRLYQNPKEREHTATLQQKAYWDNYSPEKLMNALKIMLHAH